MKIFLSWSKELSKAIAGELRHMLAAFVPGCDPWMSDHDLEPGQRWNEQLRAELADSKIAIICVTRLNCAEPWLNFEAGAISNSLGGAFVHPMLFGVEARDVPSTLSQFQVTKFEDKRFFMLVRSLNRLLPQPESEHDLKERFDRLWPGLASRISELIKNAPAPRIESPQPTAGDSLTDEAKVVLKNIALNPGSDLNMLANSSGLHHVRTEHHIDRLMEGKLVRAAYNVYEPTKYFLSDTGRAIAVVENWV